MRDLSIIVAFSWDHSIIFVPGQIHLKNIRLVKNTKKMNNLFTNWIILSSFFRWIFEKSQLNYSNYWLATINMYEFTSVVISAFSDFFL